jgi:hypothetical protein
MENPRILFIQIMFLCASVRSVVCFLIFVSPKCCANGIEIKVGMSWASRYTNLPEYSIIIKIRLLGCRL